MAPRVIKPDFDGFDDLDTGANFYDGPPPKPGMYRGKVKQFHVAKITSETSENKGKDRIHLLVEIVSKADGSKSEFAGAAVIHSLNETKQGAPFLNQFLLSLTDGSEEQSVAIRTAWWKKGKQVGDAVTVFGKQMEPILQFGRWKPTEQELFCTFIVKERTIEQGERKGEKRAEIARFVVPVNTGDDDSDTGLDDSDSDSSGDTEGFGDDGDDTPAEAPASEESTEESAPADSSGSSDSSDDGDDPWG